MRVSYVGIDIDLEGDGVDLPTTQSQTANACVVDSPANGCQAVLCGSCVDVFPDGSALRGDGARLRINGDSTHL